MISDDKFIEFMADVRGSLGNIDRGLADLKETVSTHVSSEDPHPKAERAQGEARMGRLALMGTAAGLGLQALYEWFRRHNP